MAYYMRYITADREAITFKLLKEILLNLEGEYHLKIDEHDEQRAELSYHDLRIADLEINAQGEQLFDEDMEDLIELLSFTSHPNAETVTGVLNTAQTMIVAAVYWQGDDPEPAFSLIDPLWDWLFENRPGLLQADNEGFYDAQQLILEMRTKI